MRLYLPTKTSFYVTQIFGVNPAAYARFGLKGHNGIDYATPVGTPLYASATGVVERVRVDIDGYGRHVKIEHVDCFTLYAHMSEVYVKPGQIVLAKEIIGLSGGAKSDPYAGNSTGAHLHFEVRPKPQDDSNGFGGAVNPAPHLIDWQEEQIMPESVLVGTGVVQVNGLRVRELPSYTARVMGSVDKGRVLNVYEIQNEWYHVDIGWVCSAQRGEIYVTLLPASSLGDEALLEIKNKLSAGLGEVVRQLQELQRLLG